MCDYGGQLNVPVPLSCDDMNAIVKTAALFFLKWAHRLEKVHAGSYNRYVGSCSLSAGFSDTIVHFNGIVWDVASSTQTFAASMRAM